MNGSTENRAGNAPKKSAGRELVLNLGTARKMLPLVGHIVAEILDLHRRLELLEPEQARLDRQRRTLDWPARSRRYQVREELADVEARLQAARLELEKLGIVLIDPAKGRVGLPTVVNNHAAFFSWMPGDEGLALLAFRGRNGAPRHPGKLERDGGGSVGRQQAVSSAISNIASPRIGRT